MESKPTYEELTRRLAELEEVVRALQNEEVDAVVGSRSVLMLRLKESEENIRKQREDLEALLEERSNLVEELKTHQAELEQQAEELRRSQESAREARDRYLDLYDYAPVGYLTMKKDSSVVEANLTAASLLGLKRSALVNSTFNKLIAPDSQDAFYFHVKRLTETGGSDECELLLKREYGEPFYVQLTSVIMTSGKEGDVIGTTMTDITERKRAEEALKESETRYRTTLESITDAFVSIDRQWRCTYVNETATRVLYRSRDELLGKVIWEVFPDSPEDFQISLRQVMSQGIPVHFETFYPAVNTWYECHCYPSPEGLSIFFSDVTERKNAEQELKEHRRHLEEMVRDRTARLNEQLERSAQAERRVRSLSRRLIEVQEKERRDLGHALHDEVGGTLTALKLALSQARTRHNDDAAPALNEMDEMVDELTDQIRFISHSMRPSVLDDYGLTEALQWYLERYRERTGVTISFTGDRVEEKLSPQVEAACYRIVQEALNNAAKHSGARSIEVSLSCRDEILALTVKDDGRGFDPEQITTGTGITGMQDLAELIGGSLSMDAAPGQGTCVSFELPAHVQCERGLT